MNSTAQDPLLTGRRFLLGLLGAPIAHSASPAMHERAARMMGVHCYYQLIEVAGANRTELKSLLEGIRRLGFSGINVTFPYKEMVVDLLDELSPTAAAIGAVNTIVVRDDRLIGYNTDATGFAGAVRTLVTASAHGPVAIVGAGGVGKAIAFALSGLGVREIRIFDTDRAKAEKLTSSPNFQKLKVANNVEDALRGAVGLVNATPVGMLPSRGTPVPDVLVHKGLWVADAVYWPLWTPLLTFAKAKGVHVLTGRDLAIYQAVDAFHLFTGLTPTMSDMEFAFDAVMVKRNEAINTDS